MPITYNNERLYEGQVLNHGHHYRHVDSDNSMLDNGYIADVSVWDNGKIKELHYDLGFGGEVNIEDDAPQDLQEKAQRYKELQSWFNTIRNAMKQHLDNIQDAKTIDIGKKVRVIKGRKVAIGSEWYVAEMGDSKFGPYVNLRQTANVQIGADYIKFINPDNLTVVIEEIPFEIPKPNFPSNKEVENLALTIVRGSKNLRAFHDALLKAGATEQAEVVSWQLS